MLACLFDMRAEKKRHGDSQSFLRNLEFNQGENKKKSQYQTNKKT